MCGGVFDDLGVIRWRRCLSAFSMLLLSVHHRQFLIDILSLLVTVNVIVTFTVTLILFLRSTYSNQQFCPDFPLYSADVYRLPLILPIAHMSQWMRAVFLRFFCHLLLLRFLTPLFPSSNDILSYLIFSYFIYYLLIFCFSIFLPKRLRNSQLSN